PCSSLANLACSQDFNTKRFIGAPFWVSAVSGCRLPKGAGHDHYRREPGPNLNVLLAFSWDSSGNPPPWVVDLHQPTRTGPPTPQAPDSRASSISISVPTAGRPSNASAGRPVLVNPWRE